MLVRRQPYEAVGGHAAVSSAICEDVALAQALKRAGYQVILKSGEQLIATRMYTGWRSLWVGLTKNLVDMLGGAKRTASIATCAVLLSWMAITLPVLAIIACAGQSWRPALIPALLGSAAAFGFHIGGASHFRIPLWYGLLFPVGYTVGAMLAIDSIWRRWRGRLTWKDRVYP